MIGRHLTILMVALISAQVPLAYPAGPQPSGRMIEMRWGELGPFIIGGRITTVLPDGTVLEGRALAVHEDALVLNTSRTSNKRTFPKGRTSIPRGQISILRLRETRGVVGRVSMTLLGTLVGGATGIGAAYGVENSAAGEALAWSTVIGVGVGGYYVGRAMDFKTTVIRVLPD